MESENGGRPLPDYRASSSSSMEEKEEQVMSEVHLGCPPGQNGPHISHFVVSLPPSVKDEPVESENSDTFEGKLDYDLDEDGDLILTRRGRLSRDHFIVTIRHNITSSIPRVGLQVWKAELVLADFVLHKMFTSRDLDGIVAIELGAGTGLVGMLLARVARAVFITDHGEEVLDNCTKNVHLNAGIFHCSASVYVRELDWKCSGHPQVIEDPVSEGSHSWSKSEVEEFWKASFIVAADVIYSDDLTDAFFSTLQRIMSKYPEKVPTEKLEFMLGLTFRALIDLPPVVIGPSRTLVHETRYNFSLDDLNVVANGYSHFQSYFTEGDCDDLESRSLCYFLGKRVDLTQIPQYVRGYERGNDVELWQIKYVKR